jgi:hypothetical protein
MEEVVILFRPTGPEEMELVKASGFRRWPPRLPNQPIFYPVTNEEYATQIAREWNVSESGSGYVTRFRVKASFIIPYPIQKVGGEKDGNDWAQNAIAMRYAGAVVLVGADGKEIARRSYSLGFNTIVPAGQTLTLCQFDLDLKPFLLAKPGKYTVRFAGFQAGQMESKGLVDLPESRTLKFEVAPASSKPSEP